MGGEVSAARLNEEETRRAEEAARERKEREERKARQAQQAAAAREQQEAAAARARDEDTSTSCWDASRYDDESQVPCYWAWACKEDIICNESGDMCIFPCLGLCANHRVGVVSREPELRGSRTVLARVRFGRPPRCSFWDVCILPFIPVGWSFSICNPCCEYSGLTSAFCWYCECNFCGGAPPEEPAMQLAYYPYVYVTVEQEHDSDDKHVRVTHPVCCNCSSSVVDAQAIELRTHDFVRRSEMSRRGVTTVHETKYPVHKLIARHGDATIGLTTWFSTREARRADAEAGAVVLNAALLGLPMDEGAPAQQSMTSSGAVLSTI